jgi:hypothetical protein
MIFGTNLSSHQVDEQHHHQDRHHLSRTMEYSPKWSNDRINIKVLVPILADPNISIYYIRVVRQQEVLLCHLRLCMSKTQKL